MYNFIGGLIILVKPREQSLGFFNFKKEYKDI